jgi:bile acid:Na+ symporter, BASS family
VTDLLTILLKITVVIFMAGNLLDLGLRLNLQAALRGLRDVRFVTLSLLWAFALCPALAYALTLLIPLTPAYAMGLILLGLAPCAPLLPVMAEKAHGDLNYAASFMLLASAGTVVYMPLMVPLLVSGLTVSAWAIATPMVALVLLPLVLGVVIQSRSASSASRLHPLVKKGTALDTVLMLILVLVIYGKGFVGAIGTYAIGTQVLFFAAVTAASYAFGFGMPQRQKSVVALGICTRNCGAALAPLFVAPDVDQGAIVMVTLGVPMMFGFALIGARVFGARAGRSQAPQESERAGIRVASPAEVEHHAAPPVR